MKFWDFNSVDFDKIGHPSQLAGMRRYEFAEGKAKGVEAVEVRTAAGLELTVLPGRGMDIAWVSYRGIPLSYMSKTGVVSPTYYESFGMNWLHSFFAGALTTCGLLNVGGPEKIHHPVIGEREYGLHGRISNCAAEQVSLYEEQEGDAYVMRVSGMVREGTLHGEALTLRREISTHLGAKEFTLRDTVTNRSGTAQEIMLLYHINIGYPLLNAGARLVSNTLGIEPADELAAADVDRAFVFEEPTAGTAERCFAHDMKTDADGTVKLAFINDALELGVALEYNKNELPLFNEWKMMSTKEYVVGLEPCTALPRGYSDAKARGTLQTLAAGESRTFEVTYKILDGNEEIARYEQEVMG